MCIKKLHIIWKITTDLLHGHVNILRSEVFSNERGLIHQFHCDNQLFLFLFIKCYMSKSTIDIKPSPHTICGHYWPTSEMPFNWHFTGGPMVARFYMLTGK